MEADYIGFVNTLMRYYLHLNPETLNDREWAQTYAHLSVIRKQEAKSLQQ